MLLGYLKIFISLRPQIIELLNLKIDFSYEVFNFCSPSIFKGGVIKRRPILDRLCSLKLDYVESVAGEHDGTFFAIANLFISLRLEDPVRNGFIRVVRATSEGVVFVTGLLFDVALVMILRLSVIVTHNHVIVVS